MKIDLLINTNADTTFTSGNNKKAAFTCEMIVDAVNDSHEIVDSILEHLAFDIFSLLGMRNLSAFIGELFAKRLEYSSKGLFISNPHQDGYPDLLLLDCVGKDMWDKLDKEGRLQE